MRTLIAVALLGAAAVQATAVTASSRSGHAVAEALFKAAHDHFQLKHERFETVGRDGGRVVNYELPKVGRYATSQFAADGRLVHFSVNSPDDHRTYRPIRERGQFLRTMIGIASPESSPAERQWAVAHLDDPARQWTPSFPIVVGPFVYRLYRANLHDHLEITAASPETPGWRYRPPPR